MNEVYGSYLLRISKYRVEMNNNYVRVLKLTGLKEIL